MHSNKKKWWEQVLCAGFYFLSLENSRKCPGKWSSERSGDAGMKQELSSNVHYYSKPYLSVSRPQVHPRPLPGRPEPLAQQRAPSPLPLAADVWECGHHHAPAPGSVPEVGPAARPPAEHHDPRKHRPPSARWAWSSACFAVKSGNTFISEIWDMAMSL